MCGIAGFIGKKESYLIKAMTGALSHRGPDDEGFYEDEYVSLGHRRLSIIDLSRNGKQPIANEDESIWLVVNGEIYNFKDLRESLITDGHIFRSQSDSEVILHAYEQYGDEFVSKLDGMFAISLWDSMQKKLILARDRLGIKPLYYATCGYRFVFASEIKAILQDSNFKKELNTDVFYQYLAFQCIITCETMFKGIFKLEPASILTVENGMISKKKYWSIGNNGAEINEDSAGDVLTEAVRTHLVSDVPVGVLLSGGLDSSTIVALMHRLGVPNIETFTVGFNQPDDEFEFGRQVAKRFKTNHHELIVEAKQVCILLDKIIWHMDEPLADGGVIATYLAAEKIRQFVKVVLVGEGGDETLGGYNWHKLAAFPFNLLPVKDRKKIYFYFTTFYRYRSKEPFEVFLSLFNHKENFLDSMARFEIHNVLPNSLLMKVDKMTMAHSLEARVPFLDAKFVSSALRLDFRSKISLFSTKIFLRKFMSGVLPEDILRRKKHGFIPPIHKWLKRELKEFMIETLFSSSNQSDMFIDKDFKKNILKEKNGLSGIENNSLVWRLFIFELWYKIFFKVNV